MVIFHSYVSLPEGTVNGLQFHFLEALTKVILQETSQNIPELFGKMHGKPI